MKRQVPRFEIQLLWQMLEFIVIGDEKAKCSLIRFVENSSELPISAKRAIFKFITLQSGPFGVDLRSLFGLRFKVTRAFERRRFSRGILNRLGYFLMLNPMICLCEFLLAGGRHHLPGSVVAMMHYSVVRAIPGNLRGIKSFLGTKAPPPGVWMAWGREIVRLLRHLQQFPSELAESIMADLFVVMSEENHGSGRISAAKRRCKLAMDCLVHIEEDNAAAEQIKLKVQVQNHLLHGWQEDRNDESLKFLIGKVETLGRGKWRTFSAMQLRAERYVMSLGQRDFNVAQLEIERIEMLAQELVRNGGNMLVPIAVLNLRHLRIGVLCQTGRFEDAIREIDATIRSFDRFNYATIKNLWISIMLIGELKIQRALLIGDFEGVSGAIEEHVNAIKSKYDGRPAISGYESLKGKWWSIEGVRDAIVTINAGKGDFLADCHASIESNKTEEEVVAICSLLEAYKHAWGKGSAGSNSPELDELDRAIARFVAGTDLRNASSISVRLIVCKRSIEPHYPARPGSA